MIDEGHLKRSGRIIGDTGPSGGDHLIIAIAALHGNEPAGVNALERFFSFIEENKVRMNGRLVGLMGHTAAFQQGVRFVDQDLNRIWDPERVEFVRETDRDQLRIIEELEQKELIEVIDYYLHENPNATLVDLHTTSAEGGIFSLANSLPSSEATARSIGVPTITGLSEVLHGTTMHYFEQLGLPGIAFEGGQHYKESSVDHIFAALWQVCHYLAIVDRIPAAHKPLVRELIKYGKPLPRVVKFRHRQGITEQDEFRMQPGYENFQHVRKGDHLAELNGVQLHAPYDGLILMPLYQEQGEDGFFIVEPLQP